MSQKVQYNQKVQECQSLRTVLGHFVTTPAMSTASLAAAHTGLLSTSRSSASPPSSRVASPTSSSYIALPLSRLGLSRSASVAPTPMRSASVAPTSSCSASTVPPPISTPGISTPHRSATPTVPSYCSSTPVSPSPVRKSCTMLERVFQLRRALNSNTLICLRSQMAPLAQRHMSHEGG
jgi:hypothetical protein